MSTLVELRAERLKKIERMRTMGINPYPSTARKEYTNNQIRAQFEQLEEKEVTIAGRIMSWREHGQLIFADIQDESGTLQLYIRKDAISETDPVNNQLGFEDLNLIDIGDFVECTGKVTKTRRGEISILVTLFRILTKSIRPLPEKWDGLSDQETIYRRRYLDLTMNTQRREMFQRKAKFWKVNRDFMAANGFLEVETPILEHVTGGADAQPFITHHNALDQNFYLRISPELALKRLIGGGFEKVFVLGPNFRNEGIDDEHLQEYYAIEWYWAYADYKQNMDLVSRMFRYMAQEVWGTTKFTKNNLAFDLADEWKAIDYVEIIKERHGIDIFTDSDDKMKQALKQHKVHLDGTATRNRLVDNLWKVIRKEIAGPAFLINEPKFMSPLAKSKPEQPELTERFHVILAGSEIGNGYSELNDPIDQFERFQEQQAARDAGDQESQMMDIDYVEMLEYGMPPCSGYAHSERAFWFLEGVSARAGILFPQLKHHISDQTKEIYQLDYSTPNK
ncbi:lysine--tRNA ligase [candidate division WWE3 bacterium]|nr:lysine--tRNA ligase [candidate division WWE3 bacterium]